MRVWVKRTGVILLIPIALFLLVSVLLFIPSIQTIVAKKTVTYLTESTGLDIGFEHVQLSFPLNLSVRKAFVKGAENDTLAYLSRLSASVKLRPLLDGHISVKRFYLTSLEINSGNLLDGMVVQGKAAKINFSADSINWTSRWIELNSLIFSNATFDVFLCDTITSDATDIERQPEGLLSSDTTTSVFDLIIDIKKIEFKNIALSLRMPCDSLHVNTHIEKAVLTNGVIDLGNEAYSASRFRTKISKLSYATDTEAPAPGLDVSHIQLKDLVLVADALSYQGDGAMSATIKECAVMERSGLIVKSMTGRFQMDSTQLEIPSFYLATASSNLQLQALIPWSTTHSDFTLNAKASIHKQDILLLLDDKLKTAIAGFSNSPLSVEVDAFGDSQTITVQKLMAELPDVINLQMNGTVDSFDDEHLRTGRIDYVVNTQTMNVISDLFGAMLTPGIKLPDSMSLNGYLTIDKGIYSTETTITESDGNVQLAGNFDAHTDSYELLLSIDGLEPVHFLPDDSIMCLTAIVSAKGKGFDPFHASTQTEFGGVISEIQYGNSSFTDFTFSGNLKNNQLQAELESDYPFIKGRISVDGAIKKDSVSGILIVELDTLDLYELKMSESPLSTSFQLFSEFESDLARVHSLNVTLGNWNLNIDTQAIQPKMATLAFQTNVESTHATLFAGDLNVKLSANEDLETLLDKLMIFTNEVQTQFKRDASIDLQALRPFYPDISLLIQAERDNTISHLLQEYNTFFDHLELETSISSKDGLQVESKLLALVKDTLKIDTVRIHVWQDSLGLLYEADVAKNRFRNQEAFHLNMNGYYCVNELDLLTTYTNSKGEKGIHLGINAKRELNGYYFQLYPRQPVIAFLPFTLNEDNFFNFVSMTDMDANIRLTSASNSSIWIYSDYQNNCMSDLMVELNHLNLEDISNEFKAIPSLKGLLSITGRYMPMGESFMVVADGNIDGFQFESSPIGDLLINASYLPLEKNEHQFDLHLFHDSKEVSSLSVVYKEEPSANQLGGIISVNQLPLQLINPMIPDQMVKLTGALNGEFDISGTSENPAVSGSLQLEDVSAFIAPSSTTLTFDNQQVKIDKNKLTLNNYKIYTLKDNPFVIDGTIDATNTSRPVVNLNMSTTNMQLVDSKRTAESLVYGKLLVNFNSTLSGPLQAMRVRGNMRILGGSNFSYVMADSPLNAEDNFDNLITFTYFADTLPRRTDRPLYLMRNTRGTAATASTDVLFTINIDPVVRFRIDLDKDQSNYVEMRGGGNLSLQYTTQNDMQLSGRYTMSDGTIRYSIPIIPLTEFFIKNGSYVDWRGNLMNPYLNMSAYTRVRSSVNQDGQTQFVDFNTGIELKDNLEDVSVQFIIEAPTNAVVQNQLTAMGAEERSKQAVSLLVTGVYLASGGTGTDIMNLGVALNTLIQRELKNIVGNLLDNWPISFDYNTYDGTQGMGRRTDYLGRFYKDFFNERFNTTLGIRFSTNDPVMGNKFFFDDLSLGYSLDMDGSRQIRLFQSKDYINLFEGEINKIGAGFTLQRKVKRFNDLFVFRKSNAVINKREEEE